MTFRQKLKYFLIRKAAKWLIHAIVKTCRMKIEGFEKIEELRRNNRPIIYAYWHRNIFVTIYRFKKTGARPLISLSEDGEIVSQIAEEFGMNPVRGSSSKGGARSFLELIDSIKENHSEVLISVDGPKGPSKQVKDGTVRLAQKTGSAIIPMTWSSNREKILEKTWDKFKIPKPFSRITYAYGDPLIIPPNSSGDDYPLLNTKLKESIDTLEKQTEDRCQNKKIS